VGGGQRWSVLGRIGQQHDLLINTVYVVERWLWRQGFLDVYSQSG